MEMMDIPLNDSQMSEEGAQFCLNEFITDCQYKFNEKIRHLFLPDGTPIYSTMQINASLPYIVASQIPVFRCTNTKSIDLEMVNKLKYRKLRTRGSDISEMANKIPLFPQSTYRKDSMITLERSHSINKPSSNVIKLLKKIKSKSNALRKNAINVDRAVTSRNKLLDSVEVEQDSEYDEFTKTTMKRNNLFSSSNKLVINIVSDYQSEMPSEPKHQQVVITNEEKPPQFPLTQPVSTTLRTKSKRDLLKSQGESFSKIQALKSRNLSENGATDQCVKGNELSSTILSSTVCPLQIEKCRSFSPTKQKMIISKFDPRYKKKKSTSPSGVKKNSDFVALNKKSVIGGHKTINLVLFKKYGMLINNDIPELQKEFGFSRKDLFELFAIFKSLCHISATRDKSNIEKGIDFGTFRDSIPQLSAENVELLRSLFRTIDKNLSGEIDFREFLFAMKTVRSSNIRQKLNFFFKIIDSDGNGCLSWNEIFDLCYRSLKQTVQKDEDTFMKSLAEFFTNMIFKTVQKEKWEEIPLEDIKSRISRCGPEADLLAMFCGADNFSNIKL